MGELGKLSYLIMPTYMSTFDIMGILGISRVRAQQLCRDVLSKAPYFAAFKLGRDWRIDPEGFERWNGDIHYGAIY